MLQDVAVMLADGGSCLSDLEVLAGQAELFDETASVATAWRTLEAVAADELGGVEGLRTGCARAMGWCWEPGVPLVVGLLTIDVDAPHLSAHTEKVGAAGTYKGAFGFYPLLGYVDYGPEAGGEPIAGVLRRGNPRGRRGHPPRSRLTRVERGNPVGVRAAVGDR